MGEKFLGVGLVNAVGIAFLSLTLSVILKVIFTQHEIEGLSDVIRTA